MDNLIEQYENTSSEESKMLHDSLKELQKLQTDLNLELPDIEASMSQVTIKELMEYQRKFNLYNNMTFICMIGGIVLFLLFALFGTTFKKIDVILFCCAFVSLICAIIGPIICEILNDKNKSNFSKFYKEKLILKELSQHISKVSFYTQEYKFGHISKNPQLQNADFTVTQAPEDVVGALRLGDSTCNENYITEWITGKYHDANFRFFETKLQKVSSAPNGNKVKDVIYEGQCYIFKTWINMPFAIQYQFTCSQNDDLTLENFDQIFTSGKLRVDAKGKVTLTPKSTLSAQEREVFDIIEAPMFKTCLLKLAKIYMPYWEMKIKPYLGINKLRNNHYDYLTIRLQNQNIIILRHGPFNYFEIDIDDELKKSFCKFSFEMTEFLSVLETLSSMTIVSGAKTEEILDANTADTTSSETKTKENNQKIELPHIQAIMHQDCLLKLFKYRNLATLYTVLLCLFSLGLVISFVCMLVFDLFCCLFFVGCLVNLFLILHSYNKNKLQADNYYKNVILRVPLRQHVHKLVIQDREYRYTSYPTNFTKTDDLFRLKKEQVISALGLTHTHCESTRVKEWIQGTYHGVPFRFLEAELTTGNNTTLFNGQIYIFKSVVDMPFAIQYDFKNNKRCDLTLKNFEKFFVPQKFDMFLSETHELVGQLIPQNILSSKELEVFDLIEASEFKVCLLRIAKIFQKYQNEIVLDESNFTDFGWFVRLQNNNIIIIRKGAFDYFEFNIDRDINETCRIFGNEMSEFLSILETMFALPLVSDIES